ncbi:MAG: dihydrodipicolinate synthase family protein [Rhodospirillales bacterium]|jgi:4-hydroxy-tetrahydrodipicolinate synthase|nr:dihydrodipicolinate synthase family protein [Rhodospirillales bacterium]MDP6773046.1 dihydrodipicolinate synthase family protein [Rhodospirillales bacterium]
MNTEAPLWGIIGYLITPFADDGAVDVDMLARLTDRMIEGGVHGVAPLGSTGCLPYLSDREREAVTETVCGRAKGSVPVLVGVSSLTTEGTIHHARFAEKAGAAAVMVLPVSYWKLTDDEIFRHYERVAGAVSVPVMAYNNPATGGIDMKPEFLARLMEISNITMVKESTGDIGRMVKLMQLTDGRAAIYNGHNPMALAAFAVGAKGWTTASAHLVPRLVVEFYEAVAERHDLSAARALFMDLQPLLDFIVKGGLPRTVAAGLGMLGSDVGPLRAPLLPIPDEDRATLRGLLGDLLDIEDESKHG